MEDTLADKAREEEEVPEYRVMRTENGAWEPATAQEIAELRAHDQAIMEEMQAQEEADRQAYNQHEAAMAQQWDDWAMRSELNRTQQPPSRKRVKITICARTGNGQEIGEACVEGVIDPDQQLRVTFSVVEAALGGLDGMNDATSSVPSQTAPQLADFRRDHLPGLSEIVGDFMASITGRRWLWQLNLPVIEERFGNDVAEAFQLWEAMQADTDTLVRNAADHLMEVDVEGASESESSTVEVETAKRKVDSQDGVSVARVAVEEDNTGMDRSESTLEGNDATGEDSNEGRQEGETGMEGDMPEHNVPQQNSN